MMRTYLFFAASSMVAITNAIELEQVQNTYEADNLSQLFAQLDAISAMDDAIPDAMPAMDDAIGTDAIPAMDDAISGIMRIE